MCTNAEKSANCIEETELMAQTYRSVEDTQSQQVVATCAIAYAILALADAVNKLVTIAENN